MGLWDGQRLQKRGGPACKEHSVNVGHRVPIRPTLGWGCEQTHRQRSPGCPPSLPEWSSREGVVDWLPW